MRSERREQICETKEQNPAITLRLLQKIKGQTADIRSRCPQDNDEIGMGTFIPDLSKPTLVRVAKRYMIIERDDVETTVTNAIDDTLLGQQVVGVRHDGQPRN